MFIHYLYKIAKPKTDSGQPLPAYATFYAYCLMDNHVHLLIREGSEPLSSSIKRIAAAYARYYNTKYEHYGHLFQDRFKSEPVNDEAHLLTLLSYIHQLPVAAKLCQRVEDYDWSSWREYIKAANRVSDFCAVNKVCERIPRQHLIDQVNTPLPKALLVHSFDRYRGFVPDASVIEFLTTTYHIKSPKDIKLYPKQQRYKMLKEAKDFGASIRQLSRLTTVSEHTITRAGSKKIL